MHFTLQQFIKVPFLRDFNELLEFHPLVAAGFFAPGNICLFVPFRLSVCLKKKTTTYFPSETLHGEETFICRDDTLSAEQEMRDSSTCLHNHNWHSNWPSWHQDLHLELAGTCNHSRVWEHAQEHVTSSLRLSPSTDSWHQPQSL